MSTLMMFLEFTFQGPLHFLGMLILMGAAACCVSTIFRGRP